MEYACLSEWGYGSFYPGKSEEQAEPNPYWFNLAKLVLGLGMKIDKFSQLNRNLNSLLFYDRLFIDMGSKSNFVPNLSWCKKIQSNSWKFVAGLNLIG